jgi:hypothetical protein
MPRKLTLDLDKLTVDTFETAASEPRKGTVFAEQCTCQTACTCPGCATCGNTCYQPGNGNTCEHTCAYEYTCDTCVETCANGPAGCTGNEICYV